ncbi:Crp/Fnr family transcriptional regulator [Candidatus Microgenomates bacterium]|nr:MAG: Crp/Fnr family transcriptional regulator [Candidatus Microgenomates bacterium]
MIFDKPRKLFSLFRSHDISKDFDSSLSKSLKKYGKVISIQEKKDIACEFELVFDRIYILVSGKAFLSRIEKDGRKIIFDILEEGSILGNLDFLSKEKLNPLDPLYIEPLSANIIKLYEFNKQNFLEVLSKNPTFALHILSDFSGRISRLEKKIEAIALSQIKFRLLYELIQLSSPHEILKDSFRMDIKITHEKLAEITGVVRETVSKTIKQLKEEGFIRFDKQKNMIISLEKKRESKYSFLNTSLF